MGKESLVLNMRLFPTVILCSFLGTLCAFEFTGDWKIESNAKASCLNEDKKSGIFSAQAVFPGSFLAYPEQPRYLFRPSEETFSSKTMQFSVRPEAFSGFIKAWLFVKDKDGAWFQSAQEFHLTPGKWNLLEIELNASSLLPVGHHAEWNGLYAGRIFAAGINIFSEGKGTVNIEFKRPVFTGKRDFSAPEFQDWVMPETGKVYRRISSRFQITREYFNPFDDDKIAVDFEVKGPDGKVEVYPAFYSMDCLAKHHFTKEEIKTAGCPFWEFRFIPKRTGIYEIRLCGTDKTGKEPVRFVSEWRKFKSEPAPWRGFIHPSKKTPYYFEFENGEFFYSIGLNIHSNTDQRGENVCAFGHLPDRGNIDYQEYIDHCSAAGLNLIEVWMAAWTYAIEWSSSRSGYYGLGWYNLVNAWKLDQLLAYAQKKNIFISLVLDNHGKIADNCDPEWYDAPYNTNGIFATANGATLKDPGAFWSDEKTKRTIRKRNRYICARWGAEPSVFALQLWSEVDLVSSARRNYDSGAMIKWHAEQAAFLKKNTQGKYMNSSHVCSDIDNTRNWGKMLIDLKEMDHICSDAYRGNVRITDQLKKHYNGVKNIKKPAIITEFGGSSGGSRPAYLIADIHGGIWSSLFARQAGSPMLWWHDFVHIHNHYPHYQGFSRFVKGLDLRTPEPVFGDIRVEEQIPHPGSKWKHPFVFAQKPVILPPKPDRFEGFVLHQPGKIACGWIYRIHFMTEYPLKPETIPLYTGFKIQIRRDFPAGAYCAQFYDPITNKCIATRYFIQKKKGFPEIQTPDFKIDSAFKIYPMRSSL